jgi:hypothetical protein
MTQIDTYNMTLRIPAGLAELLREQALREHRSVNAQIIKAIEAYTDTDPRTPTERAMDAFAAEVLDTQESDRP